MIKFFLIIASLMIAFQINAAELQLNVPLTVTEVKTTHFLSKNQSEYIRLRAIAELYDIYPKVTLQIFINGEEEVPTKIIKEVVLDQNYGFPSMRDAQGQIEAMEWEGRRLHLRVAGFECSLEVLADTEVGSFACKKVAAKK